MSILKTISASYAPSASVEEDNGVWGGWTVRTPPPGIRSPFYWCNNTPISSGEAAVFTTPQPPPASDNGAPYHGGESQGSVRRYLGVGGGRVSAETRQEPHFLPVDKRA